MKGETSDNKLGTQSESPAEANLNAPLKLDLEDFSEEIDELELTDEQAHELLQNLWTIMSIFVNIGWGVDTVQLLFQDLNKDVADDSVELLESKDGENEADVSM